MLLDLIERLETSQTMENNASNHNKPPNIAKMWNNDTFLEDEKVDFYLFSSLYLTMVVLVGNALNIKALMKLIKVTKVSIAKMCLDII